MFDYDAELRLYHARLMAAADIGPDSRVLDVGCGTGLTTRSAARLARDGSVVGVDVSDRMLASARDLSDAEGIGNLELVQADAASCPFPAGRFTLGISRFGTMFFTDPVAAFANIGRALQPGAPFVQLVWQDGSSQEWVTAIRGALAPDRSWPDQATGAFSLSAPAEVRRVLTEAGYVDVEVDEVREPVCYGADAAAARESIFALGMAQAHLDGLPPDQADRALERLDVMLQEHQADDGVWFGASAWLVTARRAH